MMSLRIFLVYLAISTSLLFVSCKDEEEDALSNGEGEPVPSGMARLYGEVKDADGQPVSDVALHTVYDLGVSGRPSEVQTPSVTHFYYYGTPLTTECEGTVGIPDGIPILVFWDNDSNGADPDDPQPPLCNNPPNCEDGPSQTVNRIQFAFNGAEFAFGPGTFDFQSNLVTIGDVLSPNRFYLRVFCSDGGVLWESEVMNIPEGPSEFEPSFTCDSCSGIPVVPHWSLEQSYPNPALDSVTIPFGLETAATALLTLRQMSTGDVDTLLHAPYNAGAQTESFDIRLQPNGLYEYRYVAGSFNDSRQLLKNETNPQALRNSLPMEISGNAGEFRFHTAAGQGISLRGEANESQGVAFLDRVQLIALKTGYAVAETSFTIASGESLRVDLTLQPE